MQCTLYMYMQYICSSRDGFGFYVEIQITFILSCTLDVVENSMNNIIVLIQGHHSELNRFFYDLILFLGKNVLANIRGFANICENALSERVLAAALFKCNISLLL